ncbi:MAG TPA: efflux transporter outer membrane subunit [Rhizomicrobium sp.]|jgi:NodT family efflux transporter outer membrane factor (OMF) lipoprotein
MKRLVPLLLLPLAACTVGPDYRKPDVATPGGYSELPAANAAPLSVPQASEGDLSQWWQQFGDAELQRLIATGMKENLDLQSAASRIREARQQEIVEGAAGLPSVNASGNAAHLHSNSNLLEKLGASGGSSGGSSSAPPSGGSDIKLYSLGFDASWEIDVFGGVRRAVEAAQANTEAAEWELHDGEVSLSAEIANDYCSLRATQAREQILTGEIARLQTLLKITAARAHAGFVTQLDVNEARSQLASSQAQLPSLQADARAMEHAIAILLAKPPEALVAELDSTAPLPALPKMLPVGLPSELLRRRPDVREAERRLASATAEIGVATADLYPKFNLIGGVSLASNQVNTLFSGNSLGEFGLASIMWPIFNAGKTHANIKSKEEEAKQAYLAYQKTVLGALKDVEDALTRYAAGQRGVMALAQSESSAKASAYIAEQQYKTGFVTYLNVLAAQNTWLQAQDQLAQAQATDAQNLIALYKALGGGWREDASNKS